MVVPSSQPFSTISIFWSFFLLPCQLLCLLFSFYVHFSFPVFFLFSLHLLLCRNLSFNYNICQAASIAKYVVVNQMASKCELSVWETNWENIRYPQWFYIKSPYHEMRLHWCPKSPSGPLHTSAIILPENLTNPRGWPGGPELRVLNSH